MIGSIRLFVTLFCFGYAAYCDHKTRRVDNWVWVLFAVIGTPLTFYSIYPYLFASLMVTVVVSLIAWYCGAFGGADAKALITLGLLMPTGFDGSVPYFPIVALVFGCVTSMLYIVYALTKCQNLKRLEIPLLVYLYFGIIISLFVGQWFVELIL